MRTSPFNHRRCPGDVLARAAMVPAVPATASRPDEANMSAVDTGEILPCSGHLIGKTPMVLYKPREKVYGTIICKMEMMNGSKSVKDRIAYSMVDAAERAGQITPDCTTLVEPTSGNTGIALAFVAAARGYRLALTMPESMSMERKLLLRAYGAELHLTPREQGMRGAIDSAEALAARNPHAFMLSQFENPANPDVHYRTTGPEIWRDTSGHVDFLVVGVGTGGTLSGAGRYLKERNPRLQIVAVEPAESAVLTGGCPGMHGIAGIGAGFTPKTLDVELVDDVIAVTTERAMEMARLVAVDDGMLVGTSSGAALVAALEVARRPEARGKAIITVLASSGERYLSTKTYEDLWPSSEAGFGLY